MRRVVKLVLTAIAAQATTAPALAAAAPAMPLGRTTTPPAGYVEFCAAHPGQCRESDTASHGAQPLEAFWRQAFSDDRTSALPDGSARALPQPARLPLSSSTLQLLSAVNQEVNRAIAPRSDGFAADVWSLPLADGSAVGDCEDYVLEKRRALAARGVPPETLSIAVVRTRSGESHAVLLVDTDAGELVLDNRSPWIGLWTEPDYRWIKRQSPADPGAWVRISRF